LVTEHGKANTRIVVTGASPVLAASSKSSAERRVRRSASRVRAFDDDDDEVVYRPRRYRYSAPYVYREPAYVRWYYGGYPRY
jgi:hypothetical protein